MLASALNLIIGQRLIRKLAKPEDAKNTVQEKTYMQTHIQEIQTHHDIDIFYDGTTKVPADTDVFGE